MGSADSNGTLDKYDVWGDTDFGVTSLAIGKPGASEPLLAADALITPTDDYTPERRVRPVPALADTNQPVLLVGSGFDPGADVTLRELTGDFFDETDVPGDAAADGTVVARDDLGDLDQEYQLAQGDEYGRDGRLPRKPRPRRRRRPPWRRSTSSTRARRRALSPSG